MTSIIRLPKWLAAERWTLDYDPTAPGRFVVTLLDEFGPYRGFGASVAMAARRADALRQLRRACSKASR